MRKVLLLNPPGDQLYIRDYFCTSTSRTNYYFPPLDFLVLSGTLKESYDIEVIDCIIERINLFQLLNLLDKKEYHALIFLSSASSWPGDFNAIEQILKTIKRPRYIIASGGITLFEKETFFAKYPWLDAILPAFVTPDILFYLKGDHDKIKNLFFRTRDDGIQYRTNPFTIFSYPIPLYSNFKLRKYRLPFFKYAKFVPVITNFGCPFRCSYCIGSNIKCVIRDLDNLLEELDFLHNRMGIKEILFKDYSFIANRQFTTNLLKEMISRKFKFSWSCNVHPATVKNDLISLMRKAGCYFVRIGVETQDKYLLSKYQKSTTPEVIIDAIKIIKQNRIMTMAWFMFGFYEETIENMKKTIDFAIRLDPDFASFGVLMPEYGSPLRQEYIKNGWISDRLNTFDSSGEPTIKSPNFTLEQLNRMRNSAYKKFYLRPQYWVQRLLDTKHYRLFLNTLFNGTSLLKRYIFNFSFDSYYIEMLGMSLKKICTYYFHPAYIREGLKKRKGECKSCGECCRNLFNLGIKCPLLNSKNLCSIHRIKKYIPFIRQFCYFFPTVEKFRTYKKEYQDKKCGYYWEK